MSASNRKTKIVFISTFPPVKCGIASFTQDLVYAINTEITEEITISVCALDKNKNAGLYENPVDMLIDSFNLESLIEAAKNINSDPFIELVCIEHEFGLYGGELGEYLVGFMSLLEKPFTVRFHTVLPAPSPKMLRIVQAIGLLADNVIVMTKNSARLLKEDYKIESRKIIIIPHGTHAVSTTDVNELKLEYNLANKQVLTTFGLLSPNKGIEEGILAMRKISARFPEAVYIVLGQSHPNLLKHEGEKYRNYLQELIAENNLQDNVRLINEYIPTVKLMDYLALTDIYLFTSKDPDQAVSGTFLYAMSAGCPIISNSFVLAKEMLDDRTGFIITPGSDDELAEKAIHILQNPALQKEMGNNAFLKTRNTTWQMVGQKHVQLFSGLIGTTASRQPHSTESTIQY